MKESIKSYLNQERCGFAITFEICLTIMLTAAVSLTMAYFVNAFQIQRYFADVTASTCTMASRYGGNSSKAYQIQVKRGSIQSNANAQLAYINSKSTLVHLVPGAGGQYITVSEHPDANNCVTVKLSYRLAHIGGYTDPTNNYTGAYDAGDRDITQTFKLPSLMQSGRLN